MEVNLLSILIAVIVANALGFVWYGPMTPTGKLFMKVYANSKDKNQHEMKDMGKIYAINFVLYLVTAYVLASITAAASMYWNQPMLQSGAITAFWIWIGFIVPGQLADNFFGKKTYTLVALNSGYQLISLVAMGLIIGGMA